MTGSVAVCIGSFAILLSACVSIDYAGISYPRTEQVDVFFSSQDIQHPYETMGELSGEADTNMSFEDIKEKMVERAMEAGADAILFYGKRPSNASSRPLPAGGVARTLTVGPANPAG